MLCWATLLKTATIRKVKNMTKTITIQVADNGVLIDSKWELGEDTEQTTEVFEISDCFDFFCTEERKESIDKLATILYHIADKLGYNHSKHSDNNLVIMNEADIKKEYKYLFEKGLV